MRLTLSGSRLIVVLVALVLSLSGAPARAAQLYGSVVGAVTDASGAAVPGASVTLRNAETNLVLSGVSDDKGTYTLTNVLPGRYDVTVGLEGFREFTKTGVPVGAGDVARVDVRLQVGRLSESVTVVSETSLLQTDKAVTRSEFAAKEIEDLPLSEFRNYQSLLDLVPGTTPAEFQNSSIDTPARALQTTVNGTNPNNNGTRVDGATNQYTFLPHHTLYVAPAETIATVNVSTSSFEADTGMAGGAAVTVITKSGTNQIKGSGFAFYSNNDMRGRTRFARLRDVKKQPGSDHIDGATIGGPIKRNRLFFFGAWEGQYRVSELEETYNVPTEAIRNGDFSGATGTGGAQQIIYDPATGNANGTGRLPFPDNIIPADRITALARRVQAFYPQPNIPGRQTANYFATFRDTFYRDQYDLKINWNRSGAHQVWGKIGVMDAEVSDRHKLGFEGGGLGDTKTWVLTLGQTWTLGPNFVVDSTAGYSLLDQEVHGPDFGKNWGLELGIPGTNGPDPRQSGMPTIRNGYTTVGTTEAWMAASRYDPTYTFNTNLTRLVSKHQLRFGGQVDYQALNHWQPEVGVGPRGSFTFGNGVTALRGGPQAANFYNQYAAFLLGLPTSIAKSLQYEEMTTREWKFGAYVSDRWQMSRRLTVNAGLRWEYYPLVMREHRGVERLNFDTMEVLLGGNGNIPRDVGLKVSKALFAPRLGAAFRMDEHTVLRGGYGLTYNPLPFARPLRGFYPLTIASTWVGPDTFQAAGLFENGIPAFTGPDLTRGVVPLPPTVTMRSPDPANIERGHIQSWNLTVERRLPWSVSISAGYVGTKTTDGFADVEMNWSPPGGGTAGRQYFSKFRRSASTLLWGSFTRANYHSLQVALNRPFKNGLFLKGAYTLSKAMNQADEDGWVGLNFNSPAQLHRNYALAGFDRPHNLQLAYVYALPFGKSGGKSLLSALVRDWQTNGTISVISGTPFTVTASNTSLNNFGDLQTADQVGEITRMPGGAAAFQTFYDPAAWAPISDVRFGNTGRNSVRGPGRYLANLSVFRTFPAGRTRLQLRVEGFNITNHPQWSNPNANASSTSFMQITGTREKPWRYFRVGLRATF